MKKLILFFLIPLFITQCINNQTGNESMQKSAEHKYTPEMVINKKDFVCGMPTTAGISDTAHYLGNTYGFCSPECKAAFQEDPKAYVAPK